ncbi:MAG: hypothetical protein WBB27_11570 [Maribacter sp.]
MKYEAIKVPIIKNGTTFSLEILLFLDKHKNRIGAVKVKSYIIPVARYELEATNGLKVNAMDIKITNSGSP